MDKTAARQDYPKQERLRKRKDFVEAFNEGKKIHSSHFILFLRARGQSGTRLGITASRKTGNAVVRNRLKRLIREFYRLNKELFTPGFDYSFVVKKDFRHLPWAKIAEQLSSLLAKHSKAKG